MSLGAERLFGTDGIRGKFGQAPLDRSTVTRFARALVEFLAERDRIQPALVVGGDTRESTPQIAAWLGDALRSAGGRVIDVGVVPTPGVACLVQSLGADAGIVVSASHNPYPDNGIKVLNDLGFKLDDDDEAELERRVHELARDPRPDRSSPTGASESEAADVCRKRLEPYLDSLCSSLEGERPLGGLSVVLDTGHGAASAIAGDIFGRLGASCQVLNAEPNGRNVNDGCGSTAPERAAAAVLEHGCDLGFAFDGDADRVIFCDHHGSVHDGDEILFLWARDLHQQHSLEPPSIVATSMSNLGLERALEPLGIGVVRCGVGDRQVVSTLKRHHLRLGGEQSGHMIDLERSTTGDGLLTALQLAGIVCRQGRPAADLLADFERFPQLLHNVAVRAKPPLRDLPKIHALSRSIEQELGDEGRLVLRYSGTESLARIMLEGPRLADLEEMSRRLEAVLLEETSQSELIGIRARGGHLG